MIYQELLSVTSLRRTAHTSASGCIDADTQRALDDLPTACQGRRTLMSARAENCQFPRFDLPAPFGPRIRCRPGAKPKDTSCSTGRVR